MTQLNYFIKKQGNEPFIDFLKGVAILLVLYLHTVPYLGETGAPFWALMAVPLFLIVQVFHVMKRGVFAPFIIVQILLLSFKLCLDLDNWRSIIYNDVGGRGYGPGAYYPWVYLQFALLLPLCYVLLNKLSSIVGGNSYIIGNRMRSAMWSARYSGIAIPIVMFPIYLFNMARLYNY